MAGHSDDVFHHVRDATVFEVPRFSGLGMEDGVWEIPQIFGSSFTLTKFMILEVVAAVLAYLIFTGLAKRIANGEPAKGRFWNFWEAVALFLRDQVVRPTIGTGHGHGDHGHGDHGHDGHGHAHAAAVPTGAHPADKYLPFVWSCFFFILFCNLLGAIPFLGSPTGHIWMTSTLAVFVFLHTIKEGVAASGPVGFVTSLCPPIDAPPALKPFLVAMLWVIEFFRVADQARRARDSVVCEHHGGSHRDRDDVGVHRLGGRDDVVLPGGLCQHRRAGGGRVAGVVGGLHSGLRVCVFDNNLHRSGRSSALMI